LDGQGLKDVASRLLAAHDAARTLAPITAAHPAFGVEDAYAVLFEIDARRAAQGWRRVGRKIGFSNRGLWARYGVDRPMWAPVYAQTVRYAEKGRAEISLRGFVQPRLEPEVVFKLRGPVPLDGSPREVLEAVEWMAAGFEIVQSHFPGWKFAAADCTAAFGLHGALVVGEARPLSDGDRDKLGEIMARFELVLCRGSEVVERGGGANVLGSPVLALQHLGRVVASQPEAPALAAGEVVTTGTLTDAWPLEPGSVWRAEYGALDLPPIVLEVRA
jgi:2-oxo-3-hexenedioate decarboxylase